MREKWIFKSYNELSKDELYDILKLRQIVFAVEQECVYLDVDDLDQYSMHVFTADELGIIAYLRIIEPGVKLDDVSIGRVVTASRVRRTGLGKEIMQYAIFKAKLLYPDMPIVVSAQRYLDSFYASLGFEAVGDQYMEDGIPHIKRIWND